MYYFYYCLKIKGVKLKANDTKMLVQVHCSSNLKKCCLKIILGLHVRVKETICMQAQKFI